MEATKCYIARKSNGWEIEEINVFLMDKNFTKINDNDVYSTDLDNIKRIVIKKISEELHNIDKEIDRLSKLKKDLIDTQIKLLP